jgi:hypothetical protein
VKKNIGLNVGVSLSTKTLPPIPTVRIVINGGIAEVVRKDKGVQLVIVDEDGEQVGEGTSKKTYPSYNQIGRLGKRIAR